MTDIASLSIEIDTSSAPSATKSLDALTAASGRVETATGELNRTVAENVARMKAAEDTTNRSVAATGALDSSLQKLLARYDPLGTKLRQLQSDQAALSTAMQTGAAGTGRLSDATVDKTYKALNDEISKTKGLMEVAGVATTGAGVSLENLGLSSQRARMHLMMLGREAMSGDFSRMPNSMIGLAMHSDILSSSLLPVIAGVLGVAAAAGVMIKAAYDANETLGLFNNSLAKSGDFAGTTISAMTSMAQGMASAGVITVGAANKIVAAYVGSGEIGGKMLGILSNLTVDYARITGETAEKASEQLIKMFDDPKKGAEEFAKATHSLTLEQYDLITSLKEQGKTEEAQLVLGKAISDWTNKHAEEISFATMVYRYWKKAITEAYDALGKGITDDYSTQERITKQQDAVNKLRERAANPLNLQMTTDYYNKQADAAEKLLIPLKQKLEYDKQDAQLEAAISHWNDVDIANRKIVASTDAGRLQTLLNEKQAVHDGSDKVVAAQAEAAIQKKISDLIDSMGAKGRQFLQEQIISKTQLSEISLAAAQKENDDALKLGEITKVNHDKTKTYLDLFRNAIEQSKEQQLAAASSVQGNEKQRHLDKLANLKSEAEIIAAGAQDAELWKSQQELDKHDREHFAAEEKELDSIRAQVIAQREQNEIIGLTKVQIDALEVSRLDAQITSKQTLLDFYDENHIRGAQVEIIRQEIAAQRELRGEKMSGAARQGVADEAKKAAEDWKRFTDQIETSLTDALMRGFEGGKNAGQNFIDSLKHSLETAALKIIVQAIVSPIMGTAGQALGVTGAAGTTGNLLGAASSANSLFSLGASSDAMSNAFLSGSTNFAYSGAGAALGLSTEAGVTEAGAAGIGAMGAIGAAMPYVGLALAAYSMLSSGGGKDPHNNPQVNGFQGSLGIGGVSGTSLVAGPTSGQGWWTDNSALTPAQLDAINKQVAATFAAGGGIARLLGLDPAVINSASTSSATAGDKSNPHIAPYFAGIDAALAALSDDIAKTLLPNIASFQQSNETLARTLTRVVGDMQGFDAIAKHLGMTLNLTGDAATRAGTVENIVAAGGGAQTFGSNLQAFYASFYSDTERLTNAQTDLNAQLKLLVYAVPQTKDDFRQLVTSLDLTTAGGQTLFGQLMSLAPAFAQTADAAAAAQAQIDATNKAVADDAAKAAAKAAADAATDAATAFQNAADRIKNAAAQINSIASFRSSLADARFGVMSSMPGFDAGAYYDDQVSSLTTALHGAGTVNSVLDIGGQLQAAIGNNLNAELTAINSARDARISALQQEQSTAASAAGAMQQALSSIRDYAAGLALGNLSSLSPADKLAAAKSQYQSLFARAQAGDASAMSALGGAAGNYLQSAQGYYASSAPYAAIFKDVQGGLAGLGARAGNYDPASISAQYQAQIAATTAEYSAQSLEAQNKALHAFTDLDRTMADWQDRIQSSMDEQILTNATGNDYLNGILGSLDGMDEKIGGIVAAAVERVGRAQTEGTNALIAVSQSGNQLLADKLSALDKRLSQIEANGALAAVK